MSMQTHGTQSASDQHSKENVKHVQSANVQTHGTQSASDQPSKENIKYVRPINMQIHGTQSASDRHSKEKHQAHMAYEHATELSLRSTQQRKC